MWFFLASNLLRYYREEGKVDDWDELYNKIHLYFPPLTSEEMGLLNYEGCMRDLFNLDLKALRKRISDWPVNFSMPFLEAKRAGLLAELGELQESISILEKSLQEVRSKLNLNPVTNDYSLVSQESLIMLLLQYVKSAQSYKELDFKESDELRKQ